MFYYSFIPHTLAYIDPGTGSIVLQAVAAAVAGATIVLRLFWHRILKFFGAGQSIKSEPSDGMPDHREGHGE